MRRTRIGRTKGEEMENALKLISYAGAAVLCIALAPSASAGCGHPVLPGLLTPASAQPRTAEAARSVEAQAAEAPGYQSIVGLWLDTITVGGQPFFQAFEAFTADGLEVLNDNGAPQAGNVCLGVWAATGRSTLKVNHPSWNYDNNGNVIGTVVIKSVVALQAGGNSYTGTMTIDIYDLNGNKVSPTIVGQIAATRITAN
jgi:hypothetical protein